MSYFPDRLKVTVGAEVVLSVRSDEGRVDEYTFERQIFDQMIQAVDIKSDVWEGPEELRVKVQESKKRASLSIRVSQTKREVHRVDLSNFMLMVAQYHSQARGG